MKSLVMILVMTSSWMIQASELTQVIQGKNNESLIADTVGKSLYIFDPDANKPASTCAGNCAEVWPPYIITDEEAKSVVAPFGVLARTNRKLQLTHNGLPLYTYIFDRKAGDLLGEGIGGVWHSVQVK